MTEFYKNISKAFAENASKISSSITKETGAFAGGLTVGLGKNITDLAVYPAAGAMDLWRYASGDNRDYQDTFLHKYEEGAARLGQIIGAGGKDTPETRMASHVGNMITSTLVAPHSITKAAGKIPGLGGLTKAVESNKLVQRTGLEGGLISAEGLGLTKVVEGAGAGLAKVLGEDAVSIAEYENLINSGKLKSAAPLKTSAFDAQIEVNLNPTTMSRGAHDHSKLLFSEIAKKEGTPITSIKDMREPLVKRFLEHNAELKAQGEKEISIDQFTSNYFAEFTEKLNKQNTDVSVAFIQKDLINDMKGYMAGNDIEAARKHFDTKITNYQTQLKAIDEGTFISPTGADVVTRDDILSSARRYLTNIQNEADSLLAKGNADFKSEEHLKLRKTTNELIVKLSKIDPELGAEAIKKSDESIVSKFSFLNNLFKLEPAKGDQAQVMASVNSTFLQMSERTGISLAETAKNVEGFDDWIGLDNIRELADQKIFRKFENKQQALMNKWNESTGLIDTEGALGKYIEETQLGAKDKLVKGWKEIPEKIKFKQAQRERLFNSKMSKLEEGTISAVESWKLLEEFFSPVAKTIGEAGYSVQTKSRESLVREVFMRHAYGNMKAWYKKFGQEGLINTEKFNNDVIKTTESMMVESGMVLDKYGVAYKESDGVVKIAHNVDAVIREKFKKVPLLAQVSLFMSSWVPQAEVALLSAHNDIKSIVRARGGAGALLSQVGELSTHEKTVLYGAMSNIAISTLLFGSRGVRVPVNLIEIPTIGSSFGDPDEVPDNMSTLIIKTAQDLLGLPENEISRTLREGFLSTKVTGASASRWATVPIGGWMTGRTIFESLVNKFMKSVERSVVLGSPMPMVETFIPSEGNNIATIAMTGSRVDSKGNPIDAEGTLGASAAFARDIAASKAPDVKNVGFRKDKAGDWDIKVRDRYKYYTLKDFVKKDNLITLIKESQKVYKDDDGSKAEDIIKKIIESKLAPKKSEFLRNIAKDGNDYLKMRPEDLAQLNEISLLSKDTALDIAAESAITESTGKSLAVMVKAGKIDVQKDKKELIKRIKEKYAFMQKELGYQLKPSTFDPKPAVETAVPMEEIE